MQNANEERDVCNGLERIGHYSTVQIISREKGSSGRGALEVQGGNAATN